MYDKYSELQRKYRIIDHTVRIEIVQSSSVGTGFLYTIRGSTYVYPESVNPASHFQIQS